MRSVEFKIKGNPDTYLLPVADDVTVYSAMTEVLSIMGHEWADVMPGHDFKIIDPSPCQFCSQASGPDAYMRKPICASCLAARETD
jgi:hypothetical protein